MSMIVSRLSLYPRVSISDIFAGRLEEQPCEGASTASEQTSSREKQIERPIPARHDTKVRESSRSLISRALKDAFAAVQLDKANEYLDAIEKYKSSCALLNSARIRNLRDEDKVKLDAIHATYKNRVEELVSLMHNSDIRTVASTRTAGQVKTHSL